MNVTFTKDETGHTILNVISLDLYVRIEFPEISPDLMDMLMNGNEFDDSLIDFYHNETDYRFSIINGNGVRNVLIKVHSSTNHVPLVITIPHEKIKSALTQYFSEEKLISLKK